MKLLDFENEELKNIKVMNGNIKKTLMLSLKKQWFEMTKSGIKIEDYREINIYWLKIFMLGVFDEEIDDIIKEMRLGRSFENIRKDYLCSFKEFAQNTITLGYPKQGDTERILKLEHKGIEIRTGNPEWGAEPGKLYFVIKHGKKL